MTPESRDRVNREESQSLICLDECTLRKRLNLEQATKVPKRNISRTVDKHLDTFQNKTKKGKSNILNITNKTLDLPENNSAEDDAICPGCHGRYVTAG